MKIVLLLCGLLLSGWVQAADIVDIQDGPTLAQHLTHLLPQEETHLQGTITIRRKHEGEIIVPFTSQTRIKQDSWEVTYETTETPAVRAQRLVVIHYPDRPNAYWYAKAPDPGAPLGEAKQLTAAQIFTPFANSDFWVVDLGLDFFHWPTQRLVKVQMRSGRPCKVLESVPAPEMASPYGRVLSWIDNETGGIILAEAYDRQDKRFKEFEIRAISVDHRYPKDMRIQDLKASSRTKLLFNFESEEK